MPSERATIRTELAPADLRMASEGAWPLLWVGRNTSKWIVSEYAVILAGSVTDVSLLKLIVCCMMEKFVLDLTK
jgi:hypothetical protein